MEWYRAIMALLLFWLYWATHLIHIESKIVEIKLDRKINESPNQSTFLSINQSTNQFVNEPINQSIRLRCFEFYLCSVCIRVLLIGQCELRIGLHIPCSQILISTVCMCSFNLYLISSTGRRPASYCHGVVTSCVRPFVRACVRKLFL